MRIQCVCNVYAMCVHNVCTMCMQCVYVMFTRCVHCVYTVYTQCIHCAYKVYTLCIHYVHTVFYNVCTLWVQYVYNVKLYINIHNCIHLYMLLQHQLVGSHVLMRTAALLYAWLRTQRCLHTNPSMCRSVDSQLLCWGVCDRCPWNLHRTCSEAALTKKKRPLAAKVVRKW